MDKNVNIKELIEQFIIGLKNIDKKTNDSTKYYIDKLFKSKTLFQFNNSINEYEKKFSTDENLIGLVEYLNDNTITRERFLQIITYTEFKYLNK